MTGNSEVTFSLLRNFRLADNTPAMHCSAFEEHNEADQWNELMLSSCVVLQSLDPRRVIMKTIMRSPNVALLVVTAALGTACTRSAAQELRLSDIKAQQPQETICSSNPCQRAREAPRGLIFQRYVIDPKTLVQDLNTLMERSDEVILAGVLDFATVISPSGENTVTYSEVRVVRSWKGPHHGGDTLTFGIPIGEVSCEQTSRRDGSTFFVAPPDSGIDTAGPWVYVLFLRRARGDETQLVQGFLETAGGGMQGMFAIQVPGPTYGSALTELDCAGSQNWSWRRCDSYVGTSKSPVIVFYPPDPLKKLYAGMPASDFLREVQSVAEGRGLAEKSSSR